MESILLPVSGGARSLAGTLFVPAGAASRPGLLFIHGFNSDQSGYQVRARAVNDTLDVVCLTFDLSGHGPSGKGLDDLSPRDHLVDVIVAYDALAAHPAVDLTRIGVCGASYGGYLAALLAGHRAVRRRLLRAPALYDDDQFDEPLRVRRRSCAGDGSTMATRNLASFDGDVLILESGADEVIPHAVIAAYLRAYPGARHVTIPGAPHKLTEPAFRQRFLDEIIEFFAGM